MSVDDSIKRDTLAARLGSLSPEKQALLARKLAERSRERGGEPETARDQIQPRVGEGPVPLSYAQELLWLYEQMIPGTSAYNFPMARRVRGTLDVSALTRAFNFLVERHESLRTAFREVDGVPQQFVQDPAAVVAELHDLRALPGQEREARGTQLLQEAAARPLDLTQGTGPRVVVVRLADDDALLLVVVHHIVFDGGSVGVLFRELSEAYQAALGGSEPQLAKPAIQLADYAAWERRELTQARLEPLLTFWREYLEGAPSSIDIPTDFARPSSLTGAGARYATTLGTGTRDVVRALAAANSATPFMVLLAAFQAVMHRYSGQDDIVVGTVVAGRTRSGTESLVGYLANTLALRARFSEGQTFSGLLADVRKGVVQVFDRQDIPFERLLRELRAGRQGSEQSLFNVLFTMQDAGSGIEQLGSAVVESFGVDNGAAKFDISMSASERPDGLRFVIEYRSDLFRDDTIARLVSHIEELLHSASRTPQHALSRLNIVTAPELQSMQQWNATAVEYPATATLVSLFSEQVARTPKAVAVVDEHRSLTYRELEAEATDLAHRLVAHQVGRGKLVGLLADRSVSMVVALLAIQKAGGAYVPFDPEYPIDRLQFMAEDAAVGVLIAEPHLLQGLTGVVRSEVSVVPLGQTRTAPEDGNTRFVPPAPDDAAYMIYTSGSTGRPKGALNSHRGIVNRLLWMQSEYQLSGNDVVLQKTPFSFDVSVWEFFWPLIAGARLVMAKPGGHRDPAYLAETIEKHGVTVCHFVPAMMRAFLSDPDARRCRSLRDVMASGEALPPDLVQLFARTLPSARLHNLYGPTECAVDVSYWPCPTDRASLEALAVVPIGRPVANTQLHVLDEHRQQVPIGIPGELYLAGAQVGMGYHGRPELTAERFVPNPYSARADQPRMYRTGDRARWRADGTVEYLGRLDFQVKLRGFRIELGEIETVLLAQPGVGQAVVVMRGSELNPQLVAYVVFSSNVPADDASVATLADELRRALPEYMVPAKYVALESLPLTPSGKVDRRALPAPAEDDSSGEREYIAPRTPFEEQIAAVWCEALGRERVSVEDDFFALGGHSLLAMRVVAGLAAVLPVRLTISSLWEARTVAALAALVTERESETGHAARADYVPIPPRTDSGPAPLSYAQELLWLYEQMNPDSAAYNVPLVRRVRGALDATALEGAFNVLIARHESLRTQFIEIEGTPKQRVAPSAEVTIEHIDLRGLPEEARESEAVLQLRNLVLRQIDLASGTQPRIALVSLATNESLLAIVMHHIVFDGVSAVVMLRELVQAYESITQNRAPAFAPLPIQLADFAAWERGATDSTGFGTALSFWREELAGMPASVDIPPDFARAAGTVGPGARHIATLSAETRANVRRLAKQHDASVFMTLMAGFQSLIARYTGQTDIVVGSAVAGRDRPETAGLIGYLANTLAMRARLDGDPTFAEILAQVRQRALRAFEHQHVPYEQLVRELRTDLPSAEQGLFRVVLTVQDGTVSVPQMGSLSLEPLPIELGAPKFDITLSVTELADGIRVVADYRSDLYRAETIEGLVRHFESLLNGAARNPETTLANLPLINAAERALVLDTWNDTAAPYPTGRLVHDLISEQAIRTPEAIALIGGDERLTYAEMESRANGLAAHLRSLGIAPGEMVGVMAERTPETVVNILAILKAGATYVPLDPTYPAERLAFIATDTAFRYLLGRRPVASVLGESVNVTLISPDESAPWSATDSYPGATGETIAYVIFTSGSTGRPKGVLVTHENLMVSTWARVLRYEEPVSRYLMLSSFAFDSSVAGLFWTLVQGGGLVVPGEDEYLDAGALCRLVREEKISHLLAIPTFYLEILRSANREDWGSLRVAMTGGDWCPVELIERHFAIAPDAGFYTEYGPTETTVWCSVLAILPGDPIPRVTIGNPMPNYRMYILDQGGNPSPIGVAGEIYIGGLAVSDGYLNRPELNRDLFISDPFNPVAGSRMYKTGERGRWLHNGQIEFRGRIDFQVKIRGYRVEMKEIEVTVARHPMVAHAAVVLRPERGGTVVAYVVPTNPMDPADHEASEAYRAELQRGLARYLPDYMLPSAIVLLEALPVTSSGKTDRNALPAPQYASMARHEPPQGPVEEVVASVWQQALQLDTVSRSSSFFELGGHSLLVTRVVAALAKLFRIHLPIRAMFDAPTIAGLAAALIEREAAPGQMVRVATLVLKLQAQQQPQSPTEKHTSLKTGMHA